jgi:hypothetical protein
MSDPNDSTSTSGDGVSRTSPFLEFCAKVRKDDPSILPEPGKPFKIRHLSEEEDIELADALLENTIVTYLQLDTGEYTKSSAEAMAKYVRTSKCLQRIRWNPNLILELHWRSEILGCFLLAFQESTSLKELHISFPRRGGPYNLALENMLTHTQSLQSLSLSWPAGPGDTDVAVARSGLEKNTTLRELTLVLSP